MNSMYRLTVVYDQPDDPDAFDRRYTNEHIPLVKAIPGLSGFQLSHPEGGVPYLVAELIWTSEDDYKTSAATPEMAETRMHAANCGATFTLYAGYVTQVA
ncbi:MAG: EthD family reductase [Marmoricola sp.]